MGITFDPRKDAGGVPPLRNDDDNWRSPRNPAGQGAETVADGTDFTGNVRANRRADDTSRLRFEDAHTVPPGRNDRPHAWQPMHRPTDESIEQAIHLAFSGDPDVVDGSGIQVSVVQGAVTLSGTVASQQRRMAAEDCIAELPGVTAVHNHLLVDQR
jgi:hypothetical protein